MDELENDSERTTAGRAESAADTTSSTASPDPSTAEPVTNEPAAAAATTEAIASEQTAEDAPRPHSRWTKRRLAVVSAASAFALVATGAGVGTATTLAVYRGGETSTSQASGGSSSGTTVPSQTLPDGTNGGSSGGMNGGFSYGYGFPGDQSGTGDGSDSSGSSSSTATNASDSQSAGVVLIETELGYLGGEAAGTGIVLTANGEILTNNHVVEGSTSIKVTIATTGDTYDATVVGTDSTNDVAVLQLDNASGLTVADIDTSGDLALGDTVTGVGNSEGQGYLSAVDGQVTALEQEITVNDDVTGEAKQLDGLIQTDAAIVSGDSGGPLLDDDGEVVGIDTAASSNTQSPEGYAIPIEDALEIAQQIQSGQESGTVTIGYPAFLGVQLDASATASSGAVIAGAIENTPAADAGLTQGDTITAVDGSTVSDGSDLSAAIAEHDAGDTVELTWTDAAGTSHSAQVTLIEGPAE
jgi:S1-C subfamily serine protease